jgi:CheY-like chemotaxis protein
MFKRILSRFDKKIETKINVPDKMIETMNDNKLDKDLIVDDSDPNRIVIKKYLLKHKRIADEAINGNDAIEKIKMNGTYKIIWMDIQMPKMSGIDCTKFLRNVLQYKGCIIGLTGYVDAESLKLCISAGMNNIMAKPIDKKVLAVFVEQYHNFIMS